MRPYQDFREFLSVLEQEGQLLRITERVNFEPDLAAAACALVRMGETGVLSENSIRLGIRIVGQNHRMIGADACNPLLARNVHRRPVQVAAQSAYDGPDIP
jgi:UbiD family decarboxylase